MKEKFIFNHSVLTFKGKERAGFTPPFLTTKGKERAGFTPLEYGIKKGFE